MNEFKKYNLVINTEIKDLDILTDINKKCEEYKIGLNNLYEKNVKIK